MAHLYDEEPDSRQATEEIKTTRFRPRYRQLTEDERGLHDEIKSKADELAVLFDRVPSGRYHALAITSLEIAVMWIVKQLTS